MPTARHKLQCQGTSSSTEQAGRAGRLAQHHAADLWRRIVHFGINDGQTTKPTPSQVHTQRVLQQYGYRFLWQTGWKDYRTGGNGQCKQQERVQLEKLHQKNKMLRK